MGHLPVDQFWNQTQYLFPLLWAPFTPYFRHRTIACPLETSHDTSLPCSRYFLKVFNSRVTFPHLPRCYQQVSQPCRGLFSQPLYSFVSTVKVPEERMPTSSWWLEQRNKEINERDQLLQEEQPKLRRSVRFFVTKSLPPYSPPQSRDEISCSGGELWRPGNQATVTLC